MQTMTDNYKMTEMGLIPSDWEVKSLRLIGSFKKGRGIKKDEVLPSGLPCVRYGELYTHHNEYIKKINSFISVETANESQRISKGDILFAGSGETKEEIGKCAAFLNNEETYAGGDVIIFTPKDSDSLFLGFLLNDAVIAKQKAQVGQGDAVVHIYPKGLANILIPLPPTKAEQTAIATALSDADHYISSLEKLIAKKRLLKQGAMQQLLSPKEGWVVKKLGEVGVIRKGEQLNKDTLSENDLYPVMNGGVSPSGYTNIYNQDAQTITISEGGNSCGYVNYMRSKFWQGGHCYSLKTNSNKAFLFQLLKFKEKDIMGLRVGSGLPNIQRNRLDCFELFFPTPEEQTHIATILSDMDAGIAALERQLAKARSIKQGMMQQLLTGKIRLNYDL